MANHDLSDQVRSVALEKYVQPSLRAGKTQFSVAVRDLMQDLRSIGFPAANWPQVCTAIQSKKFLRTSGLEIEGVDGPPSKQSSTVVVRYRVAQSVDRTGPDVAGEKESQAAQQEAPEEWAHRVTGKLSGLLKQEIASYGGPEGFMQWVRSEDEDPA